MQSLSSLDLNKNIVYLDSAYLLVANGCVSQHDSFTKN